jgi:hypothetical protein
MLYFGRGDVAGIEYTDDEAASDSKGLLYAVVSSSKHADAFSAASPAASVANLKEQCLTLGMSTTTTIQHLSFAAALRVWFRLADPLLTTTPGRRGSSVSSRSFPTLRYTLKTFSRIPTML